MRKAGALKLKLTGNPPEPLVPIVRFDTAPGELMQVDPRSPVPRFERTHELQHGASG